MSVERRPDSGAARRERGRQIREATTVLQNGRLHSEPQPERHNVTDPRFVQSDARPSTEDSGTWRSVAKKAAVVGGIGAAVAAVGKIAYSDRETGTFDAGKAGKALGKVVSVGGMEGAAGVAGITVRHHRELTHKSLKLSEGIQKAIDLEQRSLGVAEPYTWASVHRIHHEMEDSSLFPFYRLHHAMREAETRGLPVPETFQGLDPFVKEFDRDKVDEIGGIADQIMQKRLADERLGELQYKEPTFDDVTNEQLLEMLHPTEPQYTYPPYEKKKKAEEYSQSEIARLLLTDPHSPALMSVQGVAINGINLYQSTANMFRAIPLLKPTDLQQPADELPAEERKIKKRNAVIGGFAANAGAMFLVNRDFSGRGIARAILEGSAVNGVRGGVEILGGNVTNSAGHMGDPMQTEIARAFLNRQYEIHLKPDGTISTNTVGKGITGRVASWATLDEVGGQEYHHAHPEAIKYTDKNGIEAFVEAPWGSFLEFLAKNERATFIQEGDGFGDEPRQDVINPAIQIIQAERAKQYAIDHAYDGTIVYSKNKS